LQSNSLNIYFLKNSKYYIVLAVFLNIFSGFGQISNYVSNGSFEQLINCNTPYNVNKVKYWRSIDSLNFGNALVANTCYSTVPYANFGFQYARTGNSYAIISAFCTPTLCLINNSRGYLRNRLKANLIAGKIYCIKFYVVNSENSSVVNDAIGIYFGDNTLDTITLINKPLTYLIPQVQNPIGNIINDTLNWTLVTGTFVATGIEKHCVIGNFKNNSSTNTLTLVQNPSHNLNYQQYTNTVYTNQYIDDVSCIPTDLPAYAGADIWGIPSTTVYIGRQRDVGIDEACTWYNMSNTVTPIANAAGLTLTVALSTQTYMVKQDICGIIKYDTVVVFASALGNAELGMLHDKLQLYPNPANDFVLLAVGVTELISEYKSINIYNQLGQLIREEELSFKNNETKLSTSELPNGTYLLSIATTRGYYIKKSLIISR
jgi:hypothetical protein